MRRVHLLPLVALTLSFGSALLVTAPAAARAPARVFFTEYQYNNPKIKGMDLDGGNLGELFAIPASEWLPVGCDYDSAGGKIYWTHGSTPGTIRRANLDGSGMQLLVSGLKIPRGLALDTVNGKMYWVQSPPEGNATGLLKRANLDGTQVETVYAEDPYDPGLSYVGKPTLDPVNGYVYFNAKGEIRRMRLDLGGTVQTVVRGVTTVAAVALDVAHSHIYFADANTNSDYIGRAGLDDTGFTVLYDNTPGVFGTSGFFDMKMDLSAGRIYWTDELVHQVRRCSLDGTGMETVTTSPSGLAPTGLTFDTDPLPPVQDCNGNSVRDLDDITGGFSLDCNGNGIPDECENHPCVPVAWLVDNGSDPTGHRSVSGDPSTGYEVFQAFDLAEASEITEIGLDGWTTGYHPDGFGATVFPDDGTGTFPDEGTPLASSMFQWRFSGNTVVWVYRPVTLSLAAGRYWVRLTALHPTYAGAACYGFTGPNSFSRRLSTGSIVQSSRPVALRVRGPVPAAVPPAIAGDLRVHIEPNPARESARIRLAGLSGGRIGCAIHDAAGRFVQDLGSGAEAFTWDGKDSQGRRAVSGVYFVRLTRDGVPVRGGGSILLVR